MNSRDGKFLAIFGVFFLFLQACNNNDDVDKFLQASDVAKLDLGSVKISANRLLVNSGESAQFFAAGVSKSTATESDLTQTVDWLSSDTSVVSIDKKGLARAKADGSAIITARFAQLQSSLEFRVNTAELVSVKVEGQASINECLTQQLSASGEYDDGSERALTGTTWSVSDTKFATALENNGGALLKTHQAGALQVTANSGGVSGSLDVQILDTLQTLAISPRDVTLLVDDSRRFIATGTYSDDTGANITATSNWSTNDGNIASFDSKDAGLLTANAEGTTSLLASCGGQTDTTTVTTEIVEIDEVQIRPDQSRLTLGVNDDGYQLILRAINTDGSTTDVTEEADWTKVSPGAITIQVSNRVGSKGELRITGIGNATIEAGYEGFSDSILVVIE